MIHGSPSRVGRYLWYISSLGVKTGVGFPLDSVYSQSCGRASNWLRWLMFGPPSRTWL
ncbi:MAG: hypothetical protein LBK06_03365 [Planctomycetaceae bacterium]|nr:hypothetical protein [Planctomycetaceae bacterium]